MTIRSLLLAGAAAVSFAAPAAAITTVNVSLKVIDTFDLPLTYLGEVFSGTITYDETQLTGTDAEDLYGTEASFSITAFGQTFTEADNAFAGLGLPILGFFNGVLEFVDFIVQEEDFFGTGATTPINEPDVKIIGSLTPLFEIAPGEFVGGAGIAGPLPAIPVPASLPLAVGGLGALALLHRRKTA